MKTRNSAKLTKSFLLCLTVLIVAAWLPTSAFASTAATATIRNTVSVDYDDAAGNALPTITATADVTVNLVEATPSLSAPTDITTDPSTAAVYTYTIISNANGLDTYNLAVDSIVESAGINTSGAALSVPSIALGGSTVAVDVNIPAATATDVIVPSDSVGGDAAINGIAIGDTIVIGGNVFTVNSITDNGGVGTSTINVTGATATSVTAGDPIGEQDTFDLTVTPGTVTVNADQTITVDISAEDVGGLGGGAAIDQTITTVSVPNLSVTKEVSTDGGATFAASASADPLATLTYRITVTNGGASAADAVVISDPTPQFTAYLTNSAKSDVTPGTTYAAAATTLTDGVDGDGYDYNSTTGNTSTLAVGTVPATSSIVLYFQVTIQ